jgi:hypothetical protein
MQILEIDDGTNARIGVEVHVAVIDVRRDVWNDLNLPQLAPVIIVSRVTG